MSNNNNKETPSIFKGKGAAITLVLCFIGVIAVTGAYTLQKYRARVAGQMAQNEEIKEEETDGKSQEAAASEVVLPEENSTSVGESSENDDKSAQEQTQGTVSTGNSVSQVWFDDESLLKWPASGSVLIGYSMDKTVYFSTLDQYKYNPALIISGTVGEHIGASAPGIVSSVEQNAQTGLTVTMDMGNGYSAIYGQLKEVTVEAGEYVNTGEIVGYMSEPTKYYTVEGPNLYFEIQKDGKSVNPLDFME